MKKTLRLLLMGTMALFAGQAMAEEVTINFDADYATLFPTIAGTSSNDSHDGDFTGATASTPVSGVTVTVTPADDAKTPSRLWYSSPVLRMYSGTFTVSGTDITKIVFNSGSNFNINTSTGTLSGKTWTGEKCSEVVFNVEKNTQLKSIVVTLGEGGEVTPPEPVETDINVAKALEIISGLADGAVTDETYNVKGIVVGTPDFQRNNSGNLYGNVNFTMGDDASATELLTVFRAKYLGNVNFTEETIGNLKEGDEVIVSGQLQKYVKDDVTTPEIAQGCVITSINGKTSDDTPVTPIETTGKGTLESPYTAADANAIATQLGSGNTSTEDYYIQGKISKITYPFDAQHGTATFFISADGTETDQFQVYSTYYLNNRAWTENDTQIALGDEVIVYGKLTNYNGTPETANKQSYIYSLNGVTEGGEVVTPEPTKVTLEELLALESPTANVELELSNAKVLFNDGNYIYVRQDNSAICFYKVDAIKDLFKNNAIVSGTIRVDYEVYKLLPEVKANTFTSSDGITVEESEEEAEPTQTTLTDVDEGQNVCDLVTLTATLVRRQTYKVGEDGQVVTNEETGAPVISNTTYYLQDEEAEIVVVNNSKNLSKLADAGEIVTSETGIVSTKENIIVTGIVNTNNNAYQIKLTKNAEDANAGVTGDVNGDGTIDVADISAIISVMAGTATYADADVNKDGTVDVADISNVISIMAGK